MSALRVVFSAVVLAGVAAGVARLLAFAGIIPHPFSLVIFWAAVFAFFAKILLVWTKVHLSLGGRIMRTVIGALVIVALLAWASHHFKWPPQSLPAFVAYSFAVWSAIAAIIAGVWFDEWQERQRQRRRDVMANRKKGWSAT